ncbi:MAG: hypothetical protein KC900_09735 [Candidatus Omnitrophica bacterium]|nr:hypothetical protein [Candidatus Omnitrophota bacterium]
MKFAVRQMPGARERHRPLVAAALAVLMGILPAKGHAREMIAPNLPARPPQENIIHVPQDAWPAVLQQAPEGIFVPHKEYDDLYRRARAAYDQKLSESEVPGGWQAPRIVEAEYSAAVREDVLAFTVEYRIVQYTEEEQILPLPLNGVRYLTAEWNGAEAHIFWQNNQPAVKISGPGSHRLTVRFLSPLTLSDKVSTTSFKIPPTLLNQVRITAEPFYDITFPGAQFATTIKGEQSNKSIAFLGRSDVLSVRVENRRSSSVRTVQLYANEQHRVYLSEDLSELSAEFVVDVRNDTVDSVQVAVPKDMQVHAVTGKGVAGWSRRELPDHDVLHLDFNIAVTGIVRFTVDLYRYRDDPLAPYDFTDVRLLDAVDRQGQLSVYYDANVRVEVANAAHLRPVSAGNAQPPAKPGYYLFRRYHLYNLPYALTMNRVPVPREVELAQYNLLQLSKERMTFQSTLNLTGLDEGTARYEFPLSADFRVKDLQVFVNQQTVAEDHHHDKERGALLVSIWHPVRPADIVSIVVKAEQPVDQDDLRAGARTFEVPNFTYAPAERVAGTLRVEVDDELLLEDVRLDGYRPAEDYLIVQPQREGTKAMNYLYRVPAPHAKLTVSRRRAEQTSETVSYVAVDEDLLRANVYLRYQITAGTQDRFYFAIPAWDGSKVNIEGGQIKEKKQVPLEAVAGEIKIPAGLDLKQHVIWAVVLQEETAAAYQLTVDFQKKITQFDAFAAVPLVIPLDVSNDTGYMVLEASKNTEITTEKQGLSEVETYELPAWPSYEPSNRIIETLRYFTQPYTYRMAVKRMEELPVLAALIRSETLSYTFDTESQIFFEGSYIVRNTNQQYLQIDLPAGFVLWGATVQDKGIKPRKGADRRLYIPLPVDSDGDINLRITGQLPKGNGLGVFEHIRVRSPQLGMPVLESTLRIYYPPDYALLNVKGNFEKLPLIKPQKPLLSRFFGDAFKTVWRNLQRLVGGTHPFASRVQGRLKSAADDIGDQFTAGNTSVSGISGAVAKRMPQARYRETADEVMLEKKMASSVQYEPYYLRTDYAVDKDAAAAKKPSAPAVSYGRKKGLLSLSIQMPQEGIHVSAQKLWGDSRLALTFLAGGRERVLSAMVALLFLALGFFLQARRLMTPFMYCVAVLIGGTFAPLIALQSYVFLFNGAVAGALLFALLYILAGSLKKASAKFGLGICVAFVLLPLWSVKPVQAGEIAATFPDVAVYIPLGETTDPLAGTEPVYIPTADYFALKMLADPPYDPDPRLTGLSEYHLATITVDGKWAEDQLLMTARIDAFVNTEKDWVLMRLPFQNVFVEQMKLDGNAVPVRVSTAPVASAVKGGAPAADRQNLYELPVYGAGYHRIDVVFHAEVKSELGKKSVAFRYPPTPFSQLAIDFQSRDIFVDLSDSGAAYFLDETGSSVTLQAAPAADGAVSLSWFPRKYLKKSEKPLIYADCQVDTELTYDEIRVRQDVDIRVEKSSIAALDFRVPADTMITDVLSGNVRSWQMVTEGGKNLLRVQFKQEIADHAQVTVEARRPVTPGAEVMTVFLAPAEAERVRGHLNLFAEEDRRLMLSGLEGLTPAAMQSTRQPGQRGLVLKKSYSFLNADFAARIGVSEEERRMTATVNSEHRIQDDLLVSTYHTELDIKKNKLSTITIIIPEGQRVDRLDAPLSSGYTRQGNQLTLPLFGGVKGKYSFRLTLSRELASATEVAIESIVVEGVEKQTGRVAVYFPRGYEVTERSSEGLKSANVRPAVSAQQEIHQFDASYGYEIRATHYAAVYDIAREEPVIDAVKVYHATVEDSLVDVKLLSLFTVKAAPVDHIDMIIPADISDAISVDGDNINTVLKKPVKDGKLVAVRINLLTKFDRSYLLQVSFKKYFDQRQTFVMPQIVFPQARNRTEFISVAADTAYQVDSSETTALINVEPDSIPALPEGVDLNDILWAYRAAGGSPWSYRLDLTRLAREKLVKANILRQDITIQVIPSGYVQYETVMSINNRTLQFLPVELPKEANLWSLKVAGESVKASRQPSGKKLDRYLIPLIKSGAGDRSFEIKIVYVVPIKKLGLSGRVGLGLLKIDNIPVEKTTMTMFVPENYHVGDFKSNAEEVDISMIEADKYLDLAKELKYLTGLASSSKGELKQKVMRSRQKVIDDIGDQYSAYTSAQTELEQRVGNKKFNQKIVQSAQMKNAQILSEADQIIQTNQAVPRETRVRGKSKEKVYSQRRNVKGWSFKTAGYGAQDEVQEQVSNYLSVEDHKQQVARQQQVMNAAPQVQMVGGGFQTSQYDPNVQMDISVTAQQGRSVQRQRAVGGFQQSSYDPQLGLLEGLGGPAAEPQSVMPASGFANVYEGEQRAVQMDAFDGRRYAGDQRLAAVASLEAPETVRTEAAGREVAQEFWGGAPQRAGERASRVARDLQAPPAPQQFWGAQGEADNIPQPVVSAKLDAVGKSEAVSVKQSMLLKGYRSIDIPLPLQGRRLSFKKLGGNPELKFSYRKRGIFARAGYLVLLIIGGVTAFGLRQMSSPFGAVWTGLRRFRWLDAFYRLADSNWLLIGCTVIFLPALFSGLPLAGVMLGLISISLLRRVTRWRCRKRKISPPYTFGTFLHYSLSYALIACLVLSLVAYPFFYLMVLATILNWMYLLLFGFVTLLTRTVPADIEEDIELKAATGEENGSPDETEGDRQAPGGA